MSAAVFVASDLSDGSFVGDQSFPLASPLFCFLLLAILIQSNKSLLGVLLLNKNKGSRSSKYELLVGTTGLNPQDCNLNPPYDFLYQICLNIWTNVLWYIGLMSWEKILSSIESTHFSATTSQSLK